ncbi:hypothetical protein L195_g064498, partial [Trifolium pratense]
RGVKLGSGTGLLSDLTTRGVRPYHARREALLKMKIVL